LCLLVAGGCGDAPGDVDPSACTLAAEDRMLPLAVGASWIYEVTYDGADVTDVETVTVEAREVMTDRKDGVDAFRVRTDRVSGYDLEWWEDACPGILRHARRSFDLDGALLDDEVYQPARPGVDETPSRLEAGAIWYSAFTTIDTDPSTGEVTTDTDTDRWEVLDTDDGEVHLGRADWDDETGTYEKEWWYAAGVGKVREIGDGRTEELTEHTP
jgi:hypothetical protein